MDPSRALTILLGIKAPKEDLHLTKDIIASAEMDCPAVKELSAGGTDRPYVSGLLNTLLVIHQALDANSLGYLLRGLDSAVVRSVEEAILNNQAEQLLKEVPQIKELMSQRTAWAAGVALAFGATHIAVGAALDELSGEPHEEKVKTAAMVKKVENIEEDKEDKEADAALEASVAAPQRFAASMKGIDTLLALMSTLRPIVANVAIQSVDTNSGVGLVIAGHFSGGVTFTQLAQLNAAVKNAWPGAPDLVFQAQAGEDAEPIIFFTYRIA